MLKANDQAEKQAGGLYGTRDLPWSDELEQLQQSLLPRAGAVRPIMRRVIGGEPTHYTPATGISQSVWDVALFGSSFLSQSYHARLMADQLAMVIGAVEADPSLLSPPKPPRPTREANTGHVINIEGGIRADVVNFAQSTSGGITQIGRQAPEVTELLAALRDLETAIRDCGARGREGRLDRADNATARRALATEAARQHHL
jgi:hypothetical protein